MGQSAIVDMFVKELTDVEGKPVKVRGLEDALECVLKAVRECHARLVVRSEFDFAEKTGLDEALIDLGVKVVNVKTLPNQRVGITGVDFGVAESGSIGVVTDREEDRLVSALPFIHIALLNSKDILPAFSDLKEVFERHLDDSGGRRNKVVSLITGPSRAADHFRSPRA